MRVSHEVRILIWLTYSFVNIIYIDANHLPAVLSLAGHEIEVRLGLEHGLRVVVGLMGRHAASVLGIITLSSWRHGSRVPGTWCSGQTISSPGTRDHRHHIVPLMVVVVMVRVVVVVAIFVDHRTVGCLSGPGQAGDRWWRRLLLRLVRLEGEVRVGPGGVITPRVLDDQPVL